jgi:hypothetical protein
MIKEEKNEDLVYIDHSKNFLPTGLKPLSG